jgi:hypothetical protein
VSGNKALPDLDFQNPNFTHTFVMGKTCANSGKCCSEAERRHSVNSITGVLPDEPLDTEALDAGMNAAMKAETPPLDDGETPPVPPNTPTQKPEEQSNDQWNKSKVKDSKNPSASK